MVRVGLIGAGFIGRNHFNQYQKLGDRAKIVALCDIEADRRSGDWTKVGGNVADAQGRRQDLGDIRQYADWKELVADPDVDMVDICAPTFLHKDMAIAALKAGKHVLSEKPMALDVKQCDEMLATAGKARGKFMIAQCIRFWPECVYVKDALADKRFGPLKALHLRRQAAVPDYSWKNWIVNPKLSGGAALDLHVHDTDYALFLLGKPKAVTAQGYKRTGGGVDRLHALWEYRKGLVVQLEGFWDMPPGFGFNMGFTAVFEKAAIVYDLASGRPLTVYKWDGQSEVPTLSKDDGYFNEIRYFLECVEQNRKPKISTPQASRDAVALALAEVKSALAGGKRVAIR
ncbi:MAG TPA: Gfo/Idh/MocA family oxidoreductase [Phycisphaerae bacterium]|nr:Gfo/Idh/MocA family oxidoreductase [Phycisphaerae bacterium]